MFNYLCACFRGTFILRIDDTDQERSRPEFTTALMEAMRWLGLEWDEGPFFQVQNLDEYNREAARLLEENKAYHCYCTPEELAAGRAEARKLGKPYLYPGTCRNLSGRSACFSGGRAVTGSAAGHPDQEKPWLMTKSGDGGL